MKYPSISTDGRHALSVTGGYDYELCFTVIDSVCIVFRLIDENGKARRIGPPETAYCAGNYRMRFSIPLTAESLALDVRNCKGAIENIELEVIQ